MRIACLLILAVGLARSSEADLIHVTSGSMTGGTGPSGSMQIDIAGERGFTYDGAGGFQGNLYNPAVVCGGFLPCSSAANTGVFSGGDLSGTATLDGFTYLGVGGPNAASLFLEITGPTFQLPIDPTVLTYTALVPFSVSGLFSGTPPGLPAVSVSLTGGGDASLTFARINIPGVEPWWRFDSSSYTFATTTLATTTPVPEPSSLLLLGGGIAALISRQRRRTS